MWKQEKKNQSINIEKNVKLCIPDIIGNNMVREGIPIISHNSLLRLVDGNTRTGILKNNNVSSRKWISWMEFNREILF